MKPTLHDFSLGIALLSSLSLPGTAAAVLLTVDRADNASISTCSSAPADCSLRGAITNINALAPGAHSILFSGDLTIELDGNGLPPITQDNVAITAFANQTVVVDGNDVAPYVFQIAARDVTIFGQTLIAAVVANIRVTSTASNVTIRENLIGDTTEANDGCDSKHSNAGISIENVADFGRIYDNYIECINGPGITVLGSDDVRIGYDANDDAAPNEIRYNSTGIRSNDSNVLARDNDIMFNLVDGIEVIEGSRSNFFIANTIHTNQFGSGIVVSPPVAGPSGPGVATFLERNVIWGNGLLAIDLNDDGFTPNDPGDADVGPNTLLNHPVKTSIVGNVASGTACGGCIVEAFLAHEDPTTNGGGGSLYVGSVMAGPGGDWSFDFTSTGVAPDEATFTATSFAGSSEFSPAPEPAAAMGLAVGAGVLTWLRRLRP